MPSTGGQQDPTPTHLPAQRPVEHGVERLVGRLRLQVPDGSLLEGGVMGDGLEIDESTKLGMVGQTGGKPAIVEACELF